MLDLKKLMWEALENQLSEEKLKPKIEKKAEALVDEMISDELRSYSVFGEKLREAFQAKLNVDLGEIDLSTYNRLIEAAVINCTQRGINEERAEQLSQKINDLLEFAPQEITLNEFCEEYFEDFFDEDNHDTERLYAKLERSGSLSGSFYLIVSDSEEFCRSDILKIFISGDKISSCHEPELNPTCLYESEAFLLKCYSSGTKITEIDNFDPDLDCFFNDNFLD